MGHFGTTRLPFALGEKATKKKERERDKEKERTKDRKKERRKRIGERSRPSLGLLRSPICFVLVFFLLLLFVFRFRLFPRGYFKTIWLQFLVLTSASYVR